MDHPETPWMVAAGCGDVSQPVMDKLRSAALGPTLTMVVDEWGSRNHIPLINWSSNAKRTRVLRVTAVPAGAADAGRGQRTDAAMNPRSMRNDHGPMESPI